MKIKNLSPSRTALFASALILFGLQANALVSSPSAVGHGQWNIELKSTFERGKVEPHENRSSFQSAEIDVHQLALTKGVEGFSFGSDNFLRLDLKYLKSGKEEVSGQSFYAADTGHAATLTGGFNLAHDPAYKAGLYLSLTPISEFNKEKFSVPRVDVLGLGFNSSVELNAIFFIEDSLHYGSGIPGHQNSYLAFTHLFALRLDSVIGSQASIKWGPYAELDTSERRDSKYDAAFSAPGTQDRVRSMKVGVISSVEFAITKETYGIATYVQKLGGYDAPATNALSIALGVNF